MDAMELINFYLVPGIVVGSIYALGAVGITLVFAILRYAHLAHGDLATFGAFLALGVVTLGGVSPYVALPVAMAVTAAVAVGIDRTFYAYLRERPKIVTVMASLGVALMVVVEGTPERFISKNDQVLEGALLRRGHQAGLLEFRRGPQTRTKREVDGVRSRAGHGAGSRPLRHGVAVTGRRGLGRAVERPLLVVVVRVLRRGDRQRDGRVG